MSLLVLANAQLAYGHLPLLNRAGFALESGERLGLIGRNGTGKSSLLKVLAGHTSLDDGTLQIQQGLSMTYVAQEPSLKAEQTVFESVSEGLATVRSLRERYESLALDPTDHDALDAIQSQLDALGGWSWEQRVQETLDRLGLEGTERISSLSGGQRKRVSLAQALVTAPDVLLLDEPTNHLDIQSIEWLESLLCSHKGALILITHDRRFLDAVCTGILELDRGALQRYPGRFKDYLVQKEQALEAEALANARADKLLAQEEVWSRKGVEARRTKSVGRMARLEGLRQARAERREALGQVQLSVARGERSGKIVARLTNVNQAFGQKTILRDLSLTVLRGDKIGLIGPNGVGKSTLLKVVLGSLAPDSGQVELGTKIQVAYFDQMREGLNLEATLADTISPGSEWIEIGESRQHVRSYLGQFLFPAERAQSPVSSLSGGERNRLLLARLFARPANVLVLDEPTNDLDIETLELLEQLLQDYSGTVFLVSHDRDFVDHVVTSILAYEGTGHWREYEGGYDDYLVQRSRAMTLADAPPPGLRAASRQSSGASQEAAVQPTRRPSAQKLNSKERRELEELPVRIEALEAELDTVHRALADPDIYKSRPQEIPGLQHQQSALEADIGKAMTRWEDLLAREGQ
jgi:ATP-binding cassette subfamily F protein uup